MRYKKRKPVNKKIDLSVITADRLKPCVYCGEKPTVTASRVWWLVGCQSERCKFRPRTFYKIENEQEVFQNWNLFGGDVNID